MWLHDVLIDYIGSLFRQAAVFVEYLNAPTTWTGSRLEDPQHFACCVVSLLLENAQIIRQDPRLGHYVVLFSELSHLRRNIPEHQIFASKLPSAWEVIVVLVHIVIPEGFWLQRCTPHDVPASIVSLLEASPAQWIDHTVVSVNSVCYFKSQLELILLHFENVVLLYRLFLFWYSRRVLEENCWRSSCKRTLHQKYGLLWAIRILSNIILDFALFFHKLLHKCLSLAHTSSLSTFTHIMVRIFLNLVLTRSWIYVTLFVTAFDRHWPQSGIETIETLNYSWSLVQLSN